MRPVCFALTAFAVLGLVPAVGVTARAPASPDAPVSHNMCDAPAGWVKPFTHTYHFRNGATVVFVGVEHSDELADDTHRLLNAAFETYKPRFALIEGTSSAKSAFAWYRKDIAALATQRTTAGSASENLYAVKLAVDAGAQFSGWDFSPDQDYKLLINDGFAIEDVLGAHLLRAKVDPFAGATAASSVERQMRYAATTQPVPRFDYAAWYRRAYGTTYDPANGTPCGSGIASRVVADLSYRRNLNLAGLIATHAMPGETVLVEAGANHWLALKDWLSSRSSATT